MLDPRLLTRNQLSRWAFKHRRCIIPASGFYEWQKVGTKKQQPYYITLKDGSIMMFAGLWDRWTSPDRNVVESCTILTTSSNELVNPLHERMPVILDMKDVDLWLDYRVTHPAELKSLLKPCQSESMQLYPVSDKVNSPKNEDARCIEPT